jgi:glutamyl-tRNA synthetase
MRPYDVRVDDKAQRPPVTRLAPSPTGALHLGNARTFLLNWAMARRLGWRIVLRIEDLDTPRTKTGADAQAIQAMRWQRPHLERYHAVLGSMAERGLIYPCVCTRSQVAAAAASAPHADEHDLRYAGACRPPEGTIIPFDPTIEACWRVRVPDEAIEFVDRFAGPQAFNVQRIVGDFIVAAKSGMPAYQLAVVLDDAAAGVTQVVRGDDLLTSTPRQILLYRLLALGPPPQYSHLPLVSGPDGRRLAKRHGDSRVMSYHDRGVKPERLIGLLGEWSGLGPRCPISAAQFAERFDLDRLPRRGPIFTREDDRWLVEESS